MLLANIADGVDFMILSCFEIGPSSGFELVSSLQNNLPFSISGLRFLL